MKLVDDLVMDGNRTRVMKKTSNNIKSCRQISEIWLAAGPTQQNTRHTRSHSETAMYFVCCYAGAECRLLRS